MNRRHRVQILAAATILALASCGGEGPSDQAQPYVEAMAASVMASDDTPMNREQARCFSEGFVDVVGVEEIIKKGTPKEFGEGAEDLEFDELNLNRKQGTVIFDKFGECGVDLRASVLTELLGRDTMPAEMGTCVDTAISERRFREFFTALMISGQDAAEDDEDARDMMGDFRYCLIRDRK